MAEPANCYDLCEAPTPGSAPTAALSSLKIPSSVEGCSPWIALHNLVPSLGPGWIPDVSSLGCPLGCRASLGAHRADELHKLQSTPIRGTPEPECSEAPICLVNPFLPFPNTENELKKLRKKKKHFHSLVLIKR